MSAIKLNSSGGGSITISPASTASTLTLTAPAQTATIGIQGPAFSVYRSGNQTGVANTTFTKVQLNTETFDTNSNFDPTTNYRFTPTVAGYYQISGAVSIEGSSSITRFFSTIYKNGVETYRGADITGSGVQSVVSAVLFLNGSTDYVELYGWGQGSGIQFYGQPPSTYFTGCLVRGA